MKNLIRNIVAKSNQAVTSAADFWEEVNTMCQAEGAEIQAKQTGRATFLTRFKAVLTKDGASEELEIYLEV